MARKSYSDKCDECGVNDITRIETNPDTKEQKGYCTSCLYGNGTQCEVCDDVFVNFDWHVRESVLKGGLRP